MKTSYKDTLWLASIIPLLPILLFDGWRVRRRVPILGDAQGDSGTVGKGKVFRISIVGESTMAGVGVSHNRDGFAGYLSQEIAQYLSCAVHWRLYAKSGETVQSVIRFIETIEESDLLIIGLGGNPLGTKGLGANPLGG